MTVKAIVAGNWKMNGLNADRQTLKEILDGFPTQLANNVDLLICPPATLVGDFSSTAAHSAIMIGGQDCHVEISGAHTGEISAEMMKDCGATHVIVGHSERRTDHGETDDLVSKKVLAAWRAGLVAIICVGETEAQRDSGNAVKIVTDSLAASMPDGATSDNLIAAYEPVWAIGTGRTPMPGDVEEMHSGLRSLLLEKLGADGNSVKILYGGSVKPGNASELMAVANVNGALVGGASLIAADFLAIANAYLA